MSDSDRELRDRLEAAQAELKRALTRLNELETVATDRDVLQAQLAAAQTELKQATDRLAELEGQSTEALEDELDEVTRDRDLLRQRLEQADKTREQWDQRVSLRESELASARAEAWRLKEELTSQAKPASAPARMPRWVMVAIGASAVVASLVMLRACG